MDKIKPAFIEITRTYGIAIALLIAGIIPYLNLLYSGHGGIGWFILPIALPLGLAVAVVRILLTKGNERNFRLIVDLCFLPVYLGLAYPLAALAATSIPRTFGLPVTTWEIYRLAAIPFSLPWLF